MGGRNAKTGIGDWGQSEFSFNQGYTDAGRFSRQGGTQDQYENMTPEQREEYLAVIRDTSAPSWRPDEDTKVKDFVTKLQLGHAGAPPADLGTAEGVNWVAGLPLAMKNGGAGAPAPAAAAAAPAEDKTSLYAKLLSGTDDARKQAQDAYYQQATSRLDPQWNQREEAHRTRLLNQGLDPTSEASQNSMGDFGRDRNDAYDTAMRASVLTGNQEAHSILKDRLQAWMAENADEFTRSQALKGDQAGEMDAIMKLIPALLSMWG